MAGIGHSADASHFRHKVVRALKVEGVETGVWQSFILPQMTVFQAKNAYGHGSPWSSPHAQPVDYSLEQYPMAQKHCDSHTCIVFPLRYPNGPETVELMAEAIWKVMGQLEQLESL
jgi:hypothetical protein